MQNLRVWSGAKVRKSCRCRKRLENAPTLAIGGVDPAENGPSKVRQVTNKIRRNIGAINVSYSAIHLDDIANKVGLVETDNVHGITAKAISDGVIDATLNAEGKYLKSNPMADVYSTYEPQKALHKRIDFCMQLHAEAVRRAVDITPRKSDVILN